jgi:hypothetical protein
MQLSITLTALLALAVDSADGFNVNCTIIEPAIPDRPGFHSVILKATCFGGSQCSQLDLNQCIGLKDRDFAAVDK